MNYSKHQILAFTGHCDKYVKALAAIGEDFVTEDSHAMVTPDEEIGLMVKCTPERGA